MQVVPIAHALPHMPQWVLLVCVLTQAGRPPPPAQRTCPVGHMAPAVMQLPNTQVCAVVHARPHMPQLRLLTCVLTQAVPQRVVPPVHGAVAQTPAVQT